MFGKKSENGYQEVAGGIKIKTLVYGDQSLMTEFRLARGAELPEHTHVHEQTGYLVSGKIKLYIDEQARVMCPGDSWCVPANAHHRAEVIEDAVALEVFTPCREEYKQYQLPDDVV